MICVRSPTQAGHDLTSSLWDKQFLVDCPSSFRYIVLQDEVRDGMARADVTIYLICRRRVRAAMEVDLDLLKEAEDLKDELKVPFSPMLEELYVPQKIE